jgi:transcriptional regulator with XRE-family HTH domain
VLLYILKSYFSETMLLASLYPVLLYHYLSFLLLPQRMSIMADDSMWALYVRSYRRTQMLTQTEFADRFGVTPPTVSRWESGRQEPSLEVQKILLNLFDIRRLMTETAWRERVNSAHNHELLFAPDRGLIAVSLAACEVQGLSSAMATSRPAREFLPGGAAAIARELSPFGFASFSEMGLYSGLARQVYLRVDMRLASGVQCWSIDVWPVLSADDKSLAHVVGLSLPLCDDADAVVDLRIRVCEVTRVRAPPDGKRNRKPNNRAV